jgi:hypothetical protein
MIQFEDLGFKGDYLQLLHWRKWEEEGVTETMPWGAGGGGQLPSEHLCTGHGLTSETAARRWLFSGHPHQYLFLLSGSICSPQPRQCALPLPTSTPSPKPLRCEPMCREEQLWWKPASSACHGPPQPLPLPTPFNGMEPYILWSLKHKLSCATQYLEHFPSSWTNINIFKNNGSGLHTISYRSVVKTHQYT